MGQQVCEIVHVRRMISDLAGKDVPGCLTNKEAEPYRAVVEGTKVGLPDIVVQSQSSKPSFDKRHSFTELQFGCFIRHGAVWLSSPESRQEKWPEPGDDGMPETQTRSSNLY